MSEISLAEYVDRAREAMPWTSRLAYALSDTSGWIYATDEKIERQQGRNWCWAGVAELLSRAYGAGETQCEIAARIIIGTACCPNGRGFDGPCDYGQPIEDVLHSIDQLRGNQIKGLLAVTDVRDEIQSKRAVCCILREGNENFGHVVLITGIQNGKMSGRTKLQVQDPEDGGGNYQPSWGTLRTPGFDEHGPWVGTCKVKGLP